MGPLPQAKWEVCFGQGWAPADSLSNPAAAWLQMMTALLYRSCCAAATVEDLLLG